MTIGIDIRTLLDKYYSGVSEYTLNLVNQFLLQDKENHYSLYYNCGRDLSDRLPKFSGEKVKVISTRYSNKFFNYILQKIIHRPQIDQVLKLNAQTDVFLAPHINFLSLSAAPKKVLTIHDLSFLRYPEFFSRRKNLWHRLINIKKLVKQFDCLVAVSEHTKIDIVEILKFPAEKIKVIYAGLNPELKPITDSNELSLVKTKYNLPDNFILYLGNIEPRKNIAGLIAAYNQLRRENKIGDTKLIIAGATGWRIKEIFKTWRKSPYQSDIIFLGYIEKADKPALYSLARVFAYPSFYEGFGFPPLEAMACGAPVVSSAASSLPEVLGNAAVLVDPDNVRSLATALAEVINDGKLRESLIAKGLVRAAEFKWEKTAAAYRQLFSDLTKLNK
ncbi:MAG TPA: glycosyltransferase family 1 protein [bacterium]|nr:glycosyltransferase family 1 protein [bacterium]HPT29655.1 glycosyltransferase family 1 protein [bacterium]